MKRPRVLVLAGHDPTGGAGIDADREAADACGVEAVCVVTAWTDQDGERVASIESRRPSVWSDEARRAAVPRPAALKTGMLAGADAVRAAAALCAELRAAGLAHVVVDPVLAASGGERFLDDAGIDALLESLPAFDAVLTPNLIEAARLAEREVPIDPEERVALADLLLERGARAVLLKGGHGAEDPVRDLVARRGEEPLWLAHPRQAGRSLHGSGCRYASTVAACLARGRSLPEAARRAAEYVTGKLASGG